MNRNPGLLTLKVIIIIALLVPGCDQQAQTTTPLRQKQGQNPAATDVNPYPQVDSIPLPTGYHRLSFQDQGQVQQFAQWLRHVPLKKNTTVYLYNGQPKANQDAQFAVLDMSVGDHDLQQCADAVMRLRAEFLYAQHNPFDTDDIDFYTEQGVRLHFIEWTKGSRFRLTANKLEKYMLPGAGHPCDNRACFNEYLQTVFTYCGTRSLEKQLNPVQSWKEVQSGDVLIKGGSPGHAMIVMDVAEDSTGHRIYLLAQSYMPAQDIHIVKNPSDPHLSPWYRAPEDNIIIKTPEYTFTSNQLRAWPVTHPVD